VLTSVRHSALLAQDGDFDLAGVVKILLNLAAEVASEVNCAGIIDHVREDDDAYLSSGLHGVGLIDAGELAGEIFEALEAFDIGLQCSSARSRARC